MPELPISSSEKKTQQFSNLLIPLLILFSSFLLSHPLYFFKLLSFLSPLLVTTFLILLFTSYRALRRSTGSVVGGKGEVELQSGEEGAEENEVYKIFFEASHLKDGLQESEVLVDKFLICGDASDGVFGERLEEKKLQENNDGDNGDEKDGNAQAEKTLEELFQEKEEAGECEAVVLQVVEEKEEVKEVKEANPEVKEAIPESTNCDLGSKAEECASRAWRNSRRLSNSLRIFEKSDGGVAADEKMGLVLGGFGSMRRTEKEWKRTLACKLFEERHSNGEGSQGGGDDEEGMDLLWETYEKSDRPASVPKTNSSKKAVKDSPKKTRKKEALQKEVGDEEEEEDDGDEEEEEINGHFCCLQALKLSAGKVNLGMGKPNIARISKAFRGIGWLHHGRARKGLIH
ncbi:hypothetical protein CRG98_015356 [Punica granatum]|nr:hypothetical protein CRG98_015356 [Punica granatum]